MIQVSDTPPIDHLVMREFVSTSPASDWCHITVYMSEGHHWVSRQKKPKWFASVNCNPASVETPILDFTKKPFSQRTPPVTLPQLENRQKCLFKSSNLVRIPYLHAAQNLDQIRKSKISFFRIRTLKTFLIKDQYTHTRDQYTPTRDQYALKRGLCALKRGLYTLKRGLYTLTLFLYFVPSMTNRVGLSLQSSGSSAAVWRTVAEQVIAADKAVAT